MVLVERLGGTPLTPVNLDAWWDEPEYLDAARTSFTRQDSFILGKLSEHDPVRFKTVMDDLYRDEPPDPMDISKFEWQVILAYLGSRRTRCNHRIRRDGSSSTVRPRRRRWSKSGRRSPEPAVCHPSMPQNPTAGRPSWATARHFFSPSTSQSGAVP